MMVNLRPFFSYYGGKYRIAPRYTPPQYGTIVEPFAGSAGYSTRHPDHNVILCDLDEKIVSTWQYLIAVSETEIRSLPANVEHLDDHPDLTQEQQWLIGWWLNKGSSSPCRSMSAWGNSGVRPNCVWGAAVRDRIASQVCHIRHWKAIRCSYADIPDQDATWFVDPPYQKMGKYYRHAAKNIDFGHLGEWCRSRSGHVIACENDGADWLPFRPFYNARSATGVSVEVVREKGQSQIDLFCTTPPDPDTEPRPTPRATTSGG